MLRKIKDILYFTIAGYFRFFARIRLAAWKPRVVVITGSNGKTTALHLLETQLDGAAKYSHNANSGFGIPFDILGLKRITYSPLEWISLFLLAPLYAWRRPYAEKIYVVEADCDRPNEGEFLSSLLMPEISIWLSTARTHSKNFQKLVVSGVFGTIEEAIAHEFGFFLERTSALGIINADNPLITGELWRTSTRLYEITEEQLESYEVNREGAFGSADLSHRSPPLVGSTFKILGKEYRAPYMLPKETFYAISAAVYVADYFGIPPSTDLSLLSMPPGRSSVFRGVKGTTIIDSSYNANVDSVSVILRMVEKLSFDSAQDLRPSDKKWLILGDLTEQGVIEKEEHERVARLVLEYNFQKIILVGPRLKKYALPILQNAVSFEEPKAALNYLRADIAGGETLVFKGARFLEGIIEHLLQNNSDAAKLCRRERVWQKRRQQWGL